MSDTPRSPETSDSDATASAVGMPRWVKALLLVIIALVVILGSLALFGVWGDHGPGRHGPGQHGPQQHGYSPALAEAIRA
jgi:hypothetical protein